MFSVYLRIHRCLGPRPDLLLEDGVVGKFRPCSQPAISPSRGWRCVQSADKQSDPLLQLFQGLVAAPSFALGVLTSGAANPFRTLVLQTLMTRLTLSLLFLVPSRIVAVLAAL